MKRVRVEETDPTQRGPPPPGVPPPPFPGVDNPQDMPKGKGKGRRRKGKADSSGAPPVSAPPVPVNPNVDRADVASPPVELAVTQGGSSSSTAPAAQPAPTTDDNPLTAEPKIK